MTGKQNAVLWIGLIIVALNLSTKWSEIKSIIFSAGGSSPPGSSGSGGGIQLPIIHFPGTDIPVLAQPTPPKTAAPSGVTLV